MTYPAADLIPHQPPMRLIEQVVAYDINQLWATTAVAKLPFATADGLRTCFGLELMAQTAAAFFSLQAGDKAAPRQGMLISCRQFSSQVAAFAVDAELLIHAQLQSPLPTDASRSALVKFGAVIAVLDTANLTSADPTRLTALCADQAVADASLAVYI